MNHPDSHQAPHVPEPDNITVRGIVRRVEGESVWVEAEHGGCGRCHEKGGCGGANLTQIFCQKKKSWQLHNSIGASLGETVEISLPAHTVRHSITLAYGLPLLSALFAAIVGQAWHGESGAILGAALGLAAAFICLHFVMHNNAKSVDKSMHTCPHLIGRCR